MSPFPTDRTTLQAAARGTGSTGSSSDDNEVWYTPPQEYSRSREMTATISDDEIEIQDVIQSSAGPTQPARTARRKNVNCDRDVVISLSDDDEVENVVDNKQCLSSSVMIVSEQLHPHSRPMSTQPQNQQRCDESIENRSLAPLSQNMSSADTHQRQRQHASKSLNANMNSQRRQESTVISLNDDDEDGSDESYNSIDSDGDDDETDDEHVSGSLGESSEDERSEDIEGNEDFIDDDANDIDLEQLALEDDEEYTDDEPDFGDDVEEDEDNEDDSHEVEESEQLTESSHSTEKRFWEHLKLNEKHYSRTGMDKPARKQYNELIAQGAEAEGRKEFVSAEWCLTQCVELYEGDKNVILKLLVLALRNGTITTLDFV